MNNQFLYHPLSLYSLFEFEEIKNSIVSKLIAEKFTLADFYYVSEKVKEYSNKRMNIVENIQDIITNSSEVLEQHFEKNLYKLLHVNLSIRIIENLKEYNLNFLDLYNLDEEQLSALAGTSKKSVFQKISKALNDIIPYLDNEIIVKKPLKPLLIQIFGDLKPDVEYNIPQIISILVRKFMLKREEIELEDLEEGLNLLIQSGDIDRLNGKYRKKYISMKEFLSKEDIYQKDKLLLRLEGYSNREIADQFELSRQRLFQIENKYRIKFPKIREVEFYKDIFQTYKWTEELFIAVFETDAKIYRMLDILYDKGKESFINESFYKLDLPIAKLKLIAAYFEHLLNDDGELISYSNRMGLFEYYLSIFGIETISDEVYCETLKEVFSEKELENFYFLTEVRAVRGLAERSLRTLRNRGNAFRYYDFNLILESEIEELKRLLNLPTGVYSMRKIFVENPELMENLDIRSEYELHNLYKKNIFVEEVEYTRMPEFCVNNISKEDFLLELFFERAPILVEDFLEYSEQQYGLRQNSLRSLLSSEYSDFIHEGVIRVDYEEISLEELKKLKEILTEPVHTIDEIVQKGKLFDKDFHNRFMNNYTLEKCGYCIRGQFITLQTITNIDKYFREVILSGDYFENTRITIYKTSTYLNVMYNLERNLDIVKVDKDTYITIKKLNKVGITKEKMLNYRESATNYFHENEYFTLIRLRNKGFDHELEDYGFEDIFYERIIWGDDAIRSIPLATYAIYKKTNIDLSLKGFFSDYMVKFYSINIYTFLEYFEKEYGLRLNLGKVISIFRNSHMYYSEELAKLYLDIEIFYEEIYDHEK
ncbi:hypothetical protein A9986_09680 [Solibacillus silvestris]|nr:hypothetical protein [Solibacillus silvestris]OBW57008.1 hypothetical protein A9986_09680 [Solibacillus silvestris]